MARVPEPKRGQRELPMSGIEVNVSEASAKSIASEANALTDTQLRASPVAVSTGITQPTTPADTQPVSAASLPLPSGASTSANQSAGNTSLASIDGKLPDESGVWGYLAGTSGSVSVPANKRVLQIRAAAGGVSSASMTINGGATITLPAGGQPICIYPRGNLVAPALVFTSTVSYFVEYIE